MKSSHRYALTKISHNQKTGPIPVSATSSDSCPESCALKDGACYGRLDCAIHWRNLNEGKRGKDLDGFLLDIMSLFMPAIWRMNEVGDLPQDPDNTNRIDIETAMAICAANNFGGYCRNGFTYTHYPVLDNQASKADVLHNRAIIKAMNDHGFTVNLSANNIAEADQMMELGIGPVVCILSMEGAIPASDNKIIVCPNYMSKDVQCVNCRVCLKKNRNSIVGFPAHGCKKKSLPEVVF